ncbi:flagellar biosynthetic protein FliR [Actomonas aquatica]|uniref:Flagellar biosynthetic protein FliR n=1 Tax=Actomonas aquatica TaxID=2866162 RepID=A0ABZ1CCP5_9BACT|nr:flagellar biosynthetic protein FliR [Opitutus sp. WL0086]WRQ89268.1 flagellar biosynthetic protein FliR [Opitutus sp. WL0086]
MIALRAGGLLAMIPTVGNKPLPPTLKVAFALSLATLLTPLVPIDAGAVAGWGPLILASMGELVLGLALGWVGKFVFAAVEMAGRVITNEIGLRGAPGFDAPRPDQEPLAAALMFLAGLLFFGFGAHHQVLAAFARTFQLMPAGAGMLGPMSPETMVQGTAHVVELGLRMSAPFIAFNFLVTMAFSILSKAVPKMNVFILSFPLKIMGGMLLFAGFGMLLGRYLYVEFDRLPQLLLELAVR